MLITRSIFSRFKEKSNVLVSNSLVIFLLIFLNPNKLFADYTVASAATVDASTLTGHTGVLTISGKLVVSSNITLSGFTTVIVTAPNGNIFWNNGNYDLTFPNVEVFNIINGSPGLQPTAGNGNASTRLIIGSVIIAVSSDNSNNAPYSFEQFNAAGGLPTFSISSSPVGNACFGAPITVTLTPLNNSSRRFKCDWTINNNGSVSPASHSDFTTPQTVTITPSANNATNIQTYIITCKIYPQGDSDIITTKTISITVHPTYVWTGEGLNNLWNNADNWSLCGVPPDGSSVTIPDVTPRHFPKLNVNFFTTNNFSLLGNATLDLNGLTFELGTSTSSILNLQGQFIGSTTSSLTVFGASTTLRFSQTSVGATNALKNFIMNGVGQTVTLGNPLSVVGNIYPIAGVIASGTAGYLTMVSTEFTSSNITAISSPGADVSGVVNVQSYITGGGLGLVNRGFRSMSSPIDDTKISGDKTFKQMKTYIPITGPGGVGNGFDQGGTAQPFAETITLYNEKAPAFAPSAPSIATIDQAQVPGTGFLAFFRGSQGGTYDKNFAKLNAPFTTPDPVTITFKGPINKFDLPAIDLSYTNNANDAYNGYNLVGNPYPSSVDWQKIFQASTGPVIDAYIIVLPGGKQASYLNGVGTNITNLSSTIIQPAQGFYVRASGPGAKLFFKESSKSVLYPNRMLTSPQHVIMSTGPLAFKSSDQISSVSRVIRLKIQDEANSDETALVFADGGSELAGFEDALYFSAGPVSLASFSSDEKRLAINGLPDLAEVQAVRLNVNASSSRAVKLNFFDLSQAKGYEVFLKDTLSPGKLVDVKANPIYDFTIDKSKLETYGNERFTIVFKKEEIFPLTLNSFVAKKQNNAVELTWSIVTTGIAKEFEIEQSVDGITFHKVGSVKSQGNNHGTETYYFSDKDPVQGMNYYRIRQIHLNGRASLSEIKNVNNSLTIGITRIKIYPNPVGNQLEVDLIEHLNEPLRLNIYDTHGKKISTYTFSATQQLDYDVSKLRTGLYILDIKAEKTNKVVGRVKFVKN